MKAGRVGLIVAAGLMFGWLVYLGYLALWLPKPVVISRSQLLQASHFVKGEVSIDAAGKPVATIQVRDSFGAKRIADAEIEVDNLEKAHCPDDKQLTTGTYFLPLLAIGPNKYRVVSPAGSESLSKLTIYPWNAEVEKQVRELIR
jgi:hypothetical protein